MLWALIWAIILGLIAGFVSSKVNKLKEYAPYIGLAVASIVFIILALNIR